MSNVIETIAEDIASQFTDSVPIDTIRNTILAYLDEIQEEVEARLKDDYGLEIDYLEE